MIFITVGTHEQGLDRLLIEIDNLIEKKIINEEVFAQIGYSVYQPKNYKFEKMIGYDDMDRLVASADIVITHGGPGSIFHPLQYGKIPVVVPRDPEFNEHVDNHQILFTRRLEEKKRVIGIYDIKKLSYAILNYNKLASKCEISKSNVEKFIDNFDKLMKQKLNLGSK